jgi:hypothetical protein
MHRYTLRTSQLLCMSDEKNLGRKKGYKKSTVEKGSHVIGELLRLDKTKENKRKYRFQHLETIWHIYVLPAPGLMGLHKQEW